MAKYFKAKEMQCKHCGNVQIDMALFDLLDAIREEVGGPVRITSGYRCPEHNKAVGGAPTSFHLQGMAADITTDKVDVLRLAEIADRLNPNGGVGVYPNNNFVHVDVRGQRARWSRINGEYLGFKAAWAA